MNTTDTQNKYWCPWSVAIIKHQTRTILKFKKFANLVSFCWSFITEIRPILLPLSFSVSAWEIYSLTTMPRRDDANFRVGKSYNPRHYTPWRKLVFYFQAPGHNLWWVQEYGIRFYNRRTPKNKSAHAKNWLQTLVPLRDNALSNHYQNDLLLSEIVIQKNITSMMPLWIIKTYNLMWSKQRCGRHLYEWSSAKHFGKLKRSILKWKYLIEVNRRTKKKSTETARSWFKYCYQWTPLYVLLYLPYFPDGPCAITTRWQYTKTIKYTSITHCHSQNNGLILSVITSSESASSKKWCTGDSWKNFVILWVGFAFLRDLVRLQNNYVFLCFQPTNALEHTSCY